MRYGFLIDNRKCIGCHACTVACKSEHNVPLGVNRTWVKYVEKGRFPNTRRYFQAMRCNHCDDPPCAKICPVGAMFKRRDGIVDFDPDRCIGCKTCMQACPYDAIYIDPERQTAAKCNFCAHRIENGLEPACVSACPQHGILAGDLDDPASEIAMALARNPTTVRKPEQGTKPKLFVINGDSGTLVPTAPRYAPFYMWSQRDPKGGAVRLADNPLVDRNLLASYHVEHLRQWGMKVPLFFWTKAISAGALLFPTAAILLGHLPASSKLGLVSSSLGLAFLLVTVVLIVADLTRWTRFYTILLRPQTKSWVARGTIFLVGYAASAGALWLAAILGWEHAIVPLCWPVLLTSIGAAGYTAGLLSQCEGRDFWQNALLPLHFIVGALLSGAALFCLLPPAWTGMDTHAIALGTLGTTFIDHLFVLLGLFGMSRASDHAQYAVQVILRGPLAPAFWGGVVIAGAILPAILLLCGSGAIVSGIAAALILAGLFAFEWCLVIGGQGVPNS